MDKFIVGMFWILSLLGATLYAHEIGFIDGAINERLANQNALESCQKLAVHNMFEVEK